MMMKQKEDTMTDIHSVLQFISQDATDIDIERVITAMKYRRMEDTDYDREENGLDWNCMWYDTSLELE